MNRLLFNNDPIYRISRHLLFFSLTVLFFSLLFYMQATSVKSYLSIVWITFVNALFFFSYAYLTLFILIPEFIVKQKFLLFIFMFLIIGIGLSALKLVTSGHIFYSDIAPENIERSGIINLRFILVNTKDMSFIVALFCVVKYAKDYIHVQRQTNSLNRKYLEAQGKLLQLQFDPHFLFNTMNNLYSLSLTDEGKTKEAVGRFKVLLSGLVHEGNEPFALLSEELDMVRNFIWLQSLRYGDRLKVEFAFPDNPANYRIPSMVLFFLVENCYRHGSSDDAGNPWIFIKVLTGNKKLEIHTKNSKPPQPVSHHKNYMKGSFFLNLSKRLSILLGEDGYSVGISDQPDYDEVKLVLNSPAIENL